jgi:hypothetical protein
VLFIVVDHPHPATLSEGALMKQCTIGFGRDGGPGGQHRNKVDTAVRLVHEPSGIEVRANQRRKQYENRKVATHRMREQLAIQLRCRVPRRDYQPSELWRRRRQGQKLSVNPRHADYPALLAEAMDVVFARNFDVAGAAGMLGITMSQLARLLRHHKKAFGIVNDERTARGLPPLK